MRLSTQIHRFVISGITLVLLGGAIALQPRIQDPLGDEVIAEAPEAVVIDQAPVAVYSGSWRQMLPASLAPRRG